MKKIEYFLDRTIKNHQLFLDIETSGFSPYRDKILIINIAKYFNDKKTVCIQILNTGDEREVIYEFLNNILGYYEIITFNGNEFEEIFLNCKMKKYLIDFEFKTSKFISVKTLLKHFSKNLNLRYFSRSDVEAFFDIGSEKYFDMRKIVSDIKKNGLYYNDDLISHSKKEIETLIEIYDSLLDFLIKSSQKIDGFMYFLFDFSISSDSLNLVFATDKKSDIYKVYLDSGEKIEAKNNMIFLDLFVRTAVYNDKKVVLYEEEDGYIPLVMDDKIIYESVYYLLGKYLEFL